MNWDQISVWLTPQLHGANTVSICYTFGTSKGHWSLNILLNHILYHYLDMLFQFEVWGIRADEPCLTKQYSLHPNMMVPGDLYNVMTNPATTPSVDVP